MTQFNSKIFIHDRLCSAGHINERITYFCIILFAVPFPFMFMPHDDTTVKMVKAWFSRYKVHGFFSLKKTVVHHFLQMFLNFLPQYYQTHKHNLTNPLTPLSKSYSNHYPTLNSFDDVFFFS